MVCAVSRLNMSSLRSMNYHDHILHEQSKMVDFPSPSDHFRLSTSLVLSLSPRLQLAVLSGPLARRVLPHPKVC